MRGDGKNDTLFTCIKALPTDELSNWSWSTPLPEHNPVESLICFCFTNRSCEFSLSGLDYKHITKYFGVLKPVFASIFLVDVFLDF